MPSTDPSQREPSEVMYRGVLGIGGFLLFAAGAAMAGYAIYSLLTAGFALGTVVTLVVMSIAALLGAMMMRGARRSSAPTQPDDTDRLGASRQRGVLRTARKYDGRLTLAEVTLETRLDVDEARAVLDQFEMQGVAELQLSEAGQEVYVFPAFTDEGSDKLTARSPLDEDAEVELLFEELAEEHADEQRQEVGVSASSSPKDDSSDPG